MSTENEPLNVTQDYVAGLQRQDRLSLSTTERAFLRGYEAAERAIRQVAAPEPLREALATALHDTHTLGEWDTPASARAVADALLAHPALRAVAKGPEQAPEPLGEAAQAYLDAESEPAYSWVIESQTARDEGRPNREVERMERIATARTELVRALGAAHEERGLDWPKIAKALFREVPTCTGCDFDHSFDDHVRAVVRDTLATPAPSTEERG